MVRHLIYGVMKPRMFPELALLKSTQFLPHERIQALQQERLVRVLRHAYERSPYYRRVLAEAGVVEGERVRPERLPQVPLLDRTTLQQHQADLVARGYRGGGRQFWNRSGGTTGEPARILQDAANWQLADARKHWFAQWAGRPFGAPAAVLWGSERDLRGVGHGLMGRLRCWVTNEHLLNAYRMDSASMRRYVDEINAMRPVHILAYSGALTEFAQFIERQGLKVHSPLSITTSSSTLLPYMRETIERVFQAPVFNRYGTREVHDLAAQCERRTGLHVSALTHYVEILRPDGTAAGPGEPGEIVVTSLDSLAMPLIRYRTGDTGVWADKPCPCGRALPMLRELTGRINDQFWKRNGDFAGANRVQHLVIVENEDWIKQAQIIQQEYDRFLVRIVPQKKASGHEGRTEGITRIINLFLEEECQVEYQFVDEILPEPSGKYRYTKTEVPNPLETTGQSRPAPPRSPGPGADSPP